MLARVKLLIALTFLLIAGDPAGASLATWQKCQLTLIEKWDRFSAWRTENIIYRRLAIDGPDRVDLRRMELLNGHLVQAQERAADIALDRREDLVEIPNWLARVYPAYRAFEGPEASFAVAFQLVPIYFSTTFFTTARSLLQVEAGDIAIFQRNRLVAYFDRRAQKIREIPFVRTEYRDPGPLYEVEPNPEEAYAHGFDDPEYGPDGIYRGRF